METVTINLLTKIFQIAKLSCQSFEEVSKKIKEPAFKELLNNQQQSYKDIITECEIVAKDNKHEILDNNVLKKIKQSAAISIISLTDKNVRKYAKMLIEATTKCNVELIKALNDYFCADNRVILLGKKLSALQEKFLSELKTFLK